jgi:hypothetical protein
MTVPRSPAASAIVVFLLTCAAGVVAAYAIGATLTYDAGGEAALMTAQPLDGARKTFNWLIFCIFGAAGIIAGTAAWAGVLVNNALIESTVHQIRAMQPAASPASPAAPARPGPSFGVKPSADLDPPHL